ncbi:MAG: transposase [Proteobacteria bacterium]|nr:transposase [Pseudomonadota bacterium]
MGYEPDARPGTEQRNRRNGATRKTLKGNDGRVPIDVPRDRDGSFEPELIKKGQTRIDGMDDKIIGLYPKDEARLQYVTMQARVDKWRRGRGQ